ncbi:MAG: DegT/DnrJ/EryC1/StrS family aminotransferase [Ignavibacteriaceae bacterium]|jgi:perosamine synthetase|nr:DegT/DnrJ/EryC1/StrS family aminotransferase [Ignavibacteriaceae bacterium]
MKKIPLIKPYITEKIKAKVCEVLDSGYLTEGQVTQEFEEKFKEYVGCQYALAVCNCTVGLEMGLRAMGIGPGDEVIVPDYTYPATASVVGIVGATIVIVDVDRKTMLIDFDALEQAITSRTKAIIPVSIFGNPLDYDRLSRIKEKHNLYVIEDAACSIGAKFRQTHVGNLADISVFSLHPRKFITTGEGGMVTTNNRQWADWMLSYKHFGMGVHESRLTTVFDKIGTNYKLSNIQAAIGLTQMDYIEELLAKREQISKVYYRLLANTPMVSFPKTTIKGKHSWQSCCVFVENRDQIMKKLKERNIESQIGTYSLHMHSAFNANSKCRIMGDMQGSRFAFEYCLTLPLYHEMTNEEQGYIVQQLVMTIEDCR